MISTSAQSTSCAARVAPAAARRRALGGRHVLLAPGPPHNARQRCSPGMRVLAYQPAGRNEPQRSQQQPVQKQPVQQPQQQQPQNGNGGSSNKDQQPQPLVFASEGPQTFDVILRFGKGDERQLFASSAVLRIASKTFETALAKEQEIVGGEAVPADEMPPAALAASQHFSLDVTSKRIEEGGRVRVVHTLQVPSDQALTPEKLDTFLRLVHSMFAARRSEKPADVISWANIRSLLETSEHLGADAVMESCEEWLLRPPPAAPPPWDSSDDELLHWLVISDRVQLPRLTHKLVEELTETRRIQRVLFGPQWDFSTHNVNKDHMQRVSSTVPVPPDIELKKPVKVVDNKFEDTLKHLRPETVAEIIVRRERCGRSAFRSLCSQLAPDEEHVFSKYAGC